MNLSKLAYKTLKIYESYFKTPYPKLYITCSSGADSLALVLIFLELKNYLDLDLTLLHFNHKIRKESDEEEVFIEKLCHNHSIPFEIGRAHWQEDEIQSEASARDKRYAFFKSVMQPQSILVLAHHQEDLMETVFLNLIRGSGLRGLIGMRVFEDNKFRPFLSFNKDDLIKYLKEKDMTWCHDQSNDTLDFDRNYLRHEIIPRIKKIRGGLEDNIYNLSQSLALDWDYLQDQIDKAIKQLNIVCEPLHYAYVDRLSFQNIHSSLQPYVFFHLYEQVKGSKKDIKKNQIEKCLQLSVGKHYALSKDIYFECQSDRLLIYKITTNHCAYQDILLYNQVNSIKLDDDLKKVHKLFPSLRLIQLENSLVIEYNSKMWELGVSNLTYLEFRKPKPQDWIEVNRGRKKSFRKFLSEKQCPILIRDNVLVLAIDSKILWSSLHKTGEYNGKIS